MKLSRDGNMQVVFAVGMGLLIVAVGLFYIYQRDMGRYQKGPQAIARRPTSVQVASRVRPKMKPQPKEWNSHPEPTFRIVGQASGRKIIQKVMPSYPESAEEQGIATEVHLAFRVDEAGGVAPNIWVTQMGQPDFDAAAVQALKQWKFAPLEHHVPLAPMPDVVNDVDRGQPAVIHFTFKMIKSPMRI